MKLLLDMYKSAPKEQRDKVQLMAAERKAKAEVRAAEHLFLPRHFGALSQHVCLFLFSHSMEQANSVIVLWTNV